MKGSRIHVRDGLAVAAVVLLAAVESAFATVTVFQQGVSPGKDYAGCVDTSIRGRGWGRDRPQPKAQTLTTYADTKPLIRFDLSALDADQVIRRAILRLYYTSVPSNRKQPVEVYALKRQWDDTATWFEHKYLDGNKSEKNNWAKPGGDIDEGDFGKGAPGLVDRAASRAGPFGHVVELDVTALVAEWAAGKRPNHGFKISVKRGVLTVGSSEWPMPAYRPALVVEHYGKGQSPAPGVELALPKAPGPGAALSPVAKTPNLKQPAGPMTVVRFGRNSNCRYRKGHMAGYAKQDVRYPGNWGWTPRIRAGGSGGDFNHALFYFDLCAVPKDAVVKRASFKAFADVGNMRVPSGTDALGQVPKVTKDQRRRLGSMRGNVRNLAQYSLGLFPVAITGKHLGAGWKEQQFTFSQRRAGAAWMRGGGDLLSATESPPAAICDVGKQWAELIKQRDKVGETWLAWDVTGLVRAWVQGKLPNNGLVLDGRLMGGEIVLFSDEWVEADRRPYLEVELAGELPAGDGQFKPDPLVPTGDYWVESMKKAHARWRGTPGTFSQYGDSITVTLAFWTPLKGAKGEGMPPEMKAALAKVKEYIHRDVWRAWKNGEHGCSGGTTISWALDNIDTWQKRMNAEAAVVMWGTNDAYRGPRVPVYTEKYAAVINRILADGTVPIVTTLPPRWTQRTSMSGFMTVWNFRLATLYVARARKLPLIDLWAEMVRRRPEDWDGKLDKFKDIPGSNYDVPTLMARDGIHPSNPKKYQGDWSQQGLLHSGFNLRNYLTLKMWYEVYRKVLAE